MAAKQTSVRELANSETHRPTAGPPEKRPYRPPRLIVHGTLVELTAELGIGAVDGLGGSVIDL
jgi:hypothetical protein